MKHIVVLGGGVAGLTAAHELGERGFQVTLYERRAEAAGGKARSEPAQGTGTDGRKPLPGEHGFRFFPGFYVHVPDTMRRIPFPGNANGVFDNLVPAPRGLFAMANRPAFDILMRLPESLNDCETACAIPPHLAALGLTAEDFAFWMGRILQVLTTSEARRIVELDNVGWWDFIDAATRSPAFQLLLATGLTRNAVATQAQLANARTICDISIQLLMNMSLPGEVADRVLVGPTTDTWIEPWVTHLRQAFGVDVRMGASVEAVRFDGRQVSGITVNENGVSADVTADAYVCALPLNIAADLLPPEMIAFDPCLQGLPTLKSEMSWMTGIQFYVDYEVSMVNGHVNCIDSPWALTALSQKQFWPQVDLSTYGDGTIRDIVSVDISDWKSPAKAGAAAGKAAWDCTKDEIAEQTWLQLQSALNTPTAILKTYKSYWLDDAIVPSKGGPHLHDNLDPLLVNEAGAWAIRPDAGGHIPNFVLAGDYVRTSTDFASMESANEAGRRAVNALLTRTGYSGPAGLCMVKNLHEPDIFAPARAIDLERFARGLPWLPPAGIPAAVVARVEAVVPEIAAPIVDIEHRVMGFLERVAFPGTHPDARAIEAQEVAGLLARNASSLNPMPSAEWATYQVWSNLFFAHWPLPVSMIRPLVPDGLEIDTYEGDAFVSLVAMEMAHISFRQFGTVPGDSTFLELNLRTYVKRGAQTGVYFLRVDASSLLSDIGARLLFNLPYSPAVMSMAAQTGGTTAFRSHRTMPPIPDATYAATFAPLGTPAPPLPGSRTAFLRNRDYAFVQGHDGRLQWLAMLHDPWPVQAVDPQRTRVQVNTVLQAAGLSLPAVPLAMDFTSEISAVAWNPVTCD
jgi:uncharacterized protein YqjF (DUF2071 family)/uncharacterized protein with NAD-binding domain and iron-sulfur cluster